MAHSEGARRTAGDDGLLAEDHVSVEYQDRAADRVSGSCDTSSGGATLDCASVNLDPRVEMILLNENSAF